MLGFAYDYEQATDLRKPAPLVPSLPGELIGASAPEAGLDRRGLNLRFDKQFRGLTATVSVATQAGWTPIGTARIPGSGKASVRVPAEFRDAAQRGDVIRVAADKTAVEVVIG
jgi:hypothetical protein